MSIHSDLSELLKAEIISPETADDIRAYYQKKKEQSGNRLFVVFGILGAILVGLGIILIIAHNWDELSRTTKTFFALLPMLIGQGICAMYCSGKWPAWHGGKAQRSFCFSQLEHVFR